MAKAQKAKTLRFRTVDGKTLTGEVKNPNGTLGNTAAKVAAKFGIAGTFECLNPDNKPVSPETRLADLPDEEITLSSELTPARPH